MQAAFLHSCTLVPVVSSETQHRGAGQQPTRGLHKAAASTVAGPLRGHGDLLRV